MLGVFVWHHHGPWPVVIALAALVAVVAGLVALLRWHETTDSVSTAVPDARAGPGGGEPGKPDRSKPLRERRRCQTRTVPLGALEDGFEAHPSLAAVSANQGSLSGITSIHFARWVVIDGGKKLLFLSNYDGSWENYLDDFIDLASIGLTAIWSNTVGFPRSYFLVGGGARGRECCSRHSIRQSQVPSLVWYSAYPDLSVQNIQTNAAIREGLFAPMDADRGTGLAQEILIGP